MRLRKSVIRVIVISGAALVSASLAWAFVIQPELRVGARARQAEAREDQTRGVVRPTEAVTDQPANYDRLPEPRPFAAGSPDAEGAEPPPGLREEGGYARTYRASPAPRAAGPTPREQAVRSGLFFAERPRDVTAPAAPPPLPPGEGAGGDHEGIYNGHVLVAPRSPYELKAGAVVPAALLTAMDTARAGPVVAVVTQNVYDTVTGRHLLLPQGTRLIGRHDGDSAYGDRRAFLAWERLILPNGKSLVLGGEPGVDAQGAVGVRGQVDRRLWPLLVGTLFAGAITTLGQIAGGDDDAGSGGWLGDAGDAAAIEGSQVGGRLVDRELQVRPSIRLNAGTPVRVLITRDVILEPYRR